LLIEQLPRWDPDPVVGGRNVDHVRRVDIDSHVRRGVRVQYGGRVAARDHRPLPALRVTKEELREPRVARHRLGQRVVAVKMPSDAQHW
jgi:hypothetical protein